MTGGRDEQGRGRRSERHVSSATPPMAPGPTGRALFGEGGAKIIKCRFAQVSLNMNKTNETQKSFPVQDYLDDFP